MISLIQQFEADFLWKVSLKILKSGLILKTFTQLAIIFSKLPWFINKGCISDMIQCTQYVALFRRHKLLYRQFLHFTRQKMYSTARTSLAGILLALT